MVPHKQGCAVERGEHVQEGRQNNLHDNRVPRVTHKVQEGARGSAEPGGQRTCPSHFRELVKQTLVKEPQK